MTPRIVAVVVVIVVVVLIATTRAMAACSSFGLTSSTSDREMSGLHVRPSHSPLELQEWMARIQNSLQGIEDSVLKQSFATEGLAISVHELLQFGFREGSLQEAVPGGGKIVRPPRVEVPQDEPTPLPCIPCDLPCELGPVPERTEDSQDQGDGLTPTLAKVVPRRRSRQNSEGEERDEVEKFLASRDPQSTQYGMMHELEEHNAFRLMHVRRNLGSC